MHSNHLTHRGSPIHKYYFYTGWSKGIHSTNVSFCLLKLKRLFTNFDVFRYLLSMKTILMFSFHIMLQNDDNRIRDFFVALNPLHSGGLSQTYWYNKNGIVHFVF